MTTLRVGVSGLGSMGCRHARLLAARDGVEVHAFDPLGIDPRLVDTVGRLASVTDRWDDFFNARLDALVVAAPDAHHAPQVAAAVDAGVPVMVEKPLADSLASATALSSHVARRDTPVLLGYVLRHHPLMRRAHDLVTAGTIGEPVSVHASVSAGETLERARNRFDTDARYRLVYDYSHEWDYLEWLLGPVGRCGATARTHEAVVPVQRPNSIDAVLEFDRGLTGTVHLDYVRSDAGRWFVIVGTAGTLRTIVGAGMLERIGAKPTTERLMLSRDGMFQAQLDHFLDVVRGATPPLITVADGVRALAVAEAVREACETNAWITVGDRA